MLGQARSATSLTLWALLIALPVLLASACKEQGDVKVLSLTFKGNKALTDQDLYAVLATKASGKLPFTPTHYFNRTQFAADLTRVEQTYAERGYPAAKIKDVHVDFNQGRDGVNITLQIDEGQPVILDSVVLTGFEGLPASGQRALKRLPLKAGQPRDKRQVIASRDLAQRIWHDEGYPYATVTATETPGADAQHVVITIQAVPGGLAHFGDVTITGNTHVHPSVIHRTLTFLPGEVYSERRVVQSQRRLQSLPVFELANIEAHPVGTDQPDRVPILVTVHEAPPRRATLRLGYGSEDKARIAADWTHLNLFGGAQTGGIGAKYSSLERNAHVSFGDPAFFHHTALDVTAEVGDANEPAFTSRNAGGRLTITRLLGTRSDSPGAVSTTLKAVYTHEFLSYQIKSDSLATPADRQPLISLGLDPETGKGTGTLASIGFDVTRQATDVQVDPTRGYLVSGHIEHAAPTLGGTFRYNEISGDLRGYFPLDKRHRLASRILFGTIAAPDDASVPFSGRYFLGGSTTLRGWGLYEVSPLDPAGETIGGRTRFVFSNELRIDRTDHLSEVFFVEAGNVWAGDWEFRLRQLRYDAGAGLRYKTAVGSLRLDVGYQLNPIAGLIVGGTPSTRRFRIHFGIGEAF